MTLLKGESEMTVQEFTNNLWYGTDIVIIDKAQMYTMSGEY